MHQRNFNGFKQAAQRGRTLWALPRFRPGPERITGSLPLIHCAFSTFPTAACAQDADKDREKDAVHGMSHLSVHFRHPPTTITHRHHNPPQSTAFKNTAIPAPGASQSRQFAPPTVAAQFSSHTSSSLQRRLQGCLESLPDVVPGSRRALARTRGCSRTQHGSSPRRC